MTHVPNVQVRIPVRGGSRDTTRWARSTVSRVSSLTGAVGLGASGAFHGEEPHRLVVRKVKRAIRVRVGRGGPPILRRRASGKSASG